MNLQNKLEVFAVVTKREAEKRRDEIIEEIAKEKEEKCAEFRSSYQKMADEKIKKEETKAELEKNNVIMKKSIENKSSLINDRQKLLDEMFERIKIRLQDFIKTEDYEKRLIDDINDLYEKNKDKGEIEICLCQRDIFLADKIKEKVDVQVSSYQSDFIGGFKAIFKEQHILVDHSYLEKLNQEKKNFVGLKISY